MTIPIALIGCGGVSEMNLDGCARHPDRVRVVAACDPDPARLAHMRARYDIPAGFDSVESMTGGAEFQVALVCTPTPVRRSVVEALASAGKHVFVEKPMASSYAEAEAMVTACAQAGVQIAVDQNFRYFYPFHLARILIAEGRLGAVTQILHQDLFFRQDAGWRLGENRHAMAVMGVHWLDGFRWILGREARRVVCQARSAPTIDCVGETDATVQVEFDGGVFATYVQSFSSALAVTGTTIIGESGTLTLDYSGVTLHQRGAAPERRPNPYFGTNGENKPESAFAGLQELLSALDEGREPANSGRDNLGTIGLLEAAYRSADERRPVTFTDGAPS